MNHAKVAIFNVTNTSFNAFHENKILAKISEFTVVLVAKASSKDSVKVLKIRNLRHNTILHYSPTYPQHKKPNDVAVRQAQDDQSLLSR